MVQARLLSFFLHAAPPTPLHWWGDWGTLVVSIAITFLLTSAAIVVYLLEKRRVEQLQGSSAK